MKLTNISLSLFILSGVIFPSQVNAHPGSQRACYDRPGSVFRTSRIFRDDDPVPTWKPGKYTGGGSSRKNIKCMHGGLERHRGPKGRKVSNFCHSHDIKDTDKLVFERNRLGKNHFWRNHECGVTHDCHKKCRKTG